METFGDTKVAKSCNINFFCISCDYNTDRKSSYEKHLLTAKHKNLQLGDAKVAKSCNDLYLNIVSSAMSGGSSDEQTKNYEKIITNLAKDVIIDK